MRTSRAKGEFDRWVAVSPDLPPLDQASRSLLLRAFQAGWRSRKRLFPSAKDQRQEGEAEVTRRDER